MNLCACGHTPASHVNGVGKCYDTWAGDRYECDCREWEPRANKPQPSQSPTLGDDQ